MTTGAQYFRRRWVTHVEPTNWMLGVWWSKNSLTSRYVCGVQLGPLVVDYNYAWRNK